MGKNHLRLVALGLAVSCCGFLMAQQAGKKTKHAQKSTGEAAAVSIPLAKAPAEMAKLTSQMSGSWKTTQKFEPNPLMARGATSQGTVQINPGPAGLSLFLEFKGPRVAGAAAGGLCTSHSVIYWDEAEKGFRDLWCDATEACTLNKAGLGKWEGDKLVFNGEQLVDGKKMTTRTTFSFASRSAMKITFEGATEGGAMKPLMTVSFSK
jgi:hypothetical protein